MYNLYKAAFFIGLLIALSSKPVEKHYQQTNSEAPYTIVCTYQGDGFYGKDTANSGNLVETYQRYANHYGVDNVTCYR